MTTTSRWTILPTCRRRTTIPEAVQAVRGSLMPSPDRAPGRGGKKSDTGAFSACSPRRRPVNDAHTARRAAPETERALKSGQVWGLSSVGRALAWHARGQGFDSPRLHQIFIHEKHQIVQPQSAGLSPPCGHRPHEPPCAAAWLRIRPAGRRDFHRTRNEARFFHHQPVSVCGDECCIALQYCGRLTARTGLAERTAKHDCLFHCRRG